MRLHCSVIAAFVLSACATSNPPPVAANPPPVAANPPPVAASGSADVANVATPPHSSDPVGNTKVAAATSSAQAWLALVDQGKYGESWDAAAPIFQAAVSRDNWAAKVGSGRGPLGKLTLRKLLSAQYTTSLPGVGDGQYVVIRYAAAYENEPQAIETITPTLSQQGTWQVAGYFIK